jgi:hypothetical protein
MRMERTFAGLGVGLVVLAIGYFSLFMKQESAGEEYRAAMHEMIQSVDGYSSRPEYFQFLVDYAHDEVFSDSFVKEPRGRRRVETWVDEERYFHDLCMKMMERASEDRATHVVAALQKFKAEHEPEPRTPPASVRNRR